ALWLTGGADAALSLARTTPGVAAAQAARDASLPAPEIAAAARRGVEGATAELAMLARLRARLLVVERGVGDATPSLPGPDPGTTPWSEWDDAAVARFGTPSARGAALLARGDA